MQVVIVESPAKAKTIVKYLGKDFQVVASFGHVRDLPSRNGSVEPDNDFAMHYEISPDSTKHVKALVDAVKKADRVFLATDPDREGEAIAWHVVEALIEKKALKHNPPIHRVSFNEITKSAVSLAIKQPREIDMNLVNAQQARRALDYLVGFSLSPILWRKLPGSRSAGRVQSVALRLICERENAIDAFISQEYWHIEGDFTGPKGEKLTANLVQFAGEKIEKMTLSGLGQVEKMLPVLNGQHYAITQVEAKQQRRNPQPPFTTASLQQEASRKLGFSAKQTMQLAQRLYEGVDIGGDTVGLITYMRTDGVQVAQEALVAARSLIQKQYGERYCPTAPRQYTSKAKNAQEAHEAIRPSQFDLPPEKLQPHLDANQFKLYDLIWKRMLASQMASAELDLTALSISSDNGKDMFRATGSVLRFDGFYRVYRESRDEEEEKENALPVGLNEGSKMGLEELRHEQHFTEPPARFSEASLVAKLEELGIGRPSTYASIISVLQDREYVRLDKKRFFPEARGRLVTGFLESFFKRYVEYNFTADLEDKLDTVSEGALDWKALLQSFWLDFHQNVDLVGKQDGAAVLEALNTHLSPILFPVSENNPNPDHCPSCKVGRLSLKTSRYGAFLGCNQYPECRYTRPFATNTGSEEEGGDPSLEYPKLIGADPTTGRPIELRKGPYGLYLQTTISDEKDAKPKRVTIPAGLNPEQIPIEKAAALLSLPRLIGNHPDTSQPLLASIGRFGPYILFDKRYYTIPKTDDLLDISLERALAIMAEKNKPKDPNSKQKYTSAPDRVLGDHPKGGSVGLYKGRYGPYLKWDGGNYKLDKSLDPETCTLEEVMPALAGEATSTKKKVVAPARKKVAKKKK